MITYIVIVNWKSYPDTIECLESLVRLSDEDIRIIVVDNESSSDGVNKIYDWANGVTKASTSGPPWEQLHGQRIVQPELSSLSDETLFNPDKAKLITLFLNDENSGFAGASNIGCRLALRDEKCDFVWLLNNDTVVQSDTLTELKKSAEARPKAGICSSLLLFYDQPRIVQTAGALFNKYAGRVENLCQGKRLGDMPTGDIIAGFDYSCAASMLVSREFLLEIGLMSEDYFLYFEELDLFARNRERFATRVSRRSLVYHKEGASIGTNSRGRPSNTTLYYYNLGLIKFDMKYHVHVLPIIVLKIALVSLGFFVRGDFGGSRVVAMAVIDMVLGRKRRGLIR